MKIQINKGEIKRIIESFKKENEDLGKIIYPILEKYELEKKEVLEICQIGKFVHKIDTNIRITDKPKPPSPDFIIEYKNELIGLEHTQVLTEDASRYFKIKTLLAYAEKEFEKKYPNTNVYAQISIQNDELNYKQSEKAQLAEEIVDMVHSKLQEMEFDLPEYITQIKTSKHSKVSFSYKEENWQAGYLSKERLQEEVLKKEHKLLRMKKYLLYTALILSAVTLISNIVEFDFNNLNNNSFAPLISSFFFSVVFIILIRDKKNQIEKENNH
ncbi:hypothetical protein pgond44_03518 [Psychroflexus gondwanensis ACAM 44]|uniref:Uncharacterized protein n=1 Tax=Psychroflexus gondwanensis ACAM 44 TaxID=1189619 RepID=N1X2I2_9FLAO|nr:hypothetical protein [Psychroflexus gondwanensis]EMY82273.1 hypothetical protein pgond44_03518 [Psychroflexus gondwanensis ACAM 44]